MIAKERSPYALVTVVERGRLRLLELDGRVQSAMDPHDPDYMPYTYSQLMGTAVAAWPGSQNDAPAEMLVVGLGGGTLPRHAVQRYPRLSMYVVELDPVVVKFAKAHFGIGDRMQITVMDGRRFLETNTRRYDIIALDAFGPKYIPPSLMTREFLEVVRARLKPGGLLTVNTWVSSRWSDLETRTYQEVFPLVFELLHPDEPTSNRILVAGPAVPSMEALRSQALATDRRKKFREFSVPRILSGLRLLSKRSDVPVLTDENVRRLTGQR